MKRVEITRQRLLNQHLVGPRLPGPDGVVRWLGAVQAQDYGGAKWALAQRAEPTTSAAIDRLLAAGTIVRTHAMRPTWHLVAAEDIRWIQALTALRVHNVNGTMYRKLELDDALLRKSEALLVSALEGGRHLTRTALAEHLAAGGIPAAGMRLAYILMSAELNALICSGPLSGKQHTYALLDERVPAMRQLGREEALAELASRYFASHGPAQLQDFVWWSGLTVADGRAAIAHAGTRLARHEIEGTPYWSAESHRIEEPGASAQLLPNFDEYFIAYRDRSAYEAPFDAPPPPGIFDWHILVVDGKVVGAWRVTLTARTATITVTPLISLGEREGAAIEEAARRYGQFVERSVMVEIIPPA